MASDRRLRRAFGATALAAVTASMLANCASEYGATDSGATTPDGASDSTNPPRSLPDGSETGASLSDGGECPGNGGPKAVRVGTLIGNEFCIDTTEVTREQYVAFLKSNPQPTHPRCMYKTSFAPNVGWPPSGAEGDLPVVNVDWCDAWTFCAWAGKRLCGKIGGGSMEEASHRASFRINQFLHACSGGGMHAYAYADAYAPGVCNGPDAASLVPVGTMPSCQGGFPGLFDMSGNASEMLDACDPPDGSDGKLDSCYAVAGSFTEANGYLTHRCFAEGKATRGTPYRNLGFRCCGP